MLGSMVYVFVSTCVTTKTKVGGKRKSHQFAPDASPPKKKQNRIENKPMMMMMMMMMIMMNF